MADPKQIIIGKDAFIGINLDDLCDFARRHVLVLPETLLYECATTRKAMQLRLIGRFENLASMGSHACESVEAMIRCEARNCLPYGSIAARHGEYEIHVSTEVLQARRAQYDEFVRQWIAVAQGYHDRLSRGDPNLLAVVRTGDASKEVCPDRLRCWLESVDSQDMHAWSRGLFEGMSDTPDRFCASDDWVAWHFLRLYGVVFLEQTFLMHKGGPSGATAIEHDLQDIFYVTLLCRAEGLLSRDQRLVQPLARAAFPGKGVFSSLEEVPDSYRCDWACPGEGGGIYCFLHPVPRILVRANRHSVRECA